MKLLDSEPLIDGLAGMACFMEIVKVPHDTMDVHTYIVNYVMLPFQNVA